MIGRAIDRRLYLLAAVVPMSLLIGSGIGRRLMRFAFANAAAWALEPPVATLPNCEFAVGATAYHVDFWCTPALLWLGAALLLLTTRPSFLGFARALALVLPLSAAALVANVTLSIALHQRGVDWTWAHYPGLLLIYAATLFYCQRPIRPA